jgi:hypothetical protein
LCTAIYEPFKHKVSDKIAEMLSLQKSKAEVKIIFQTVEDLHIACPKNLDWYFTETILLLEAIESNRAIFMRVKMRERIKN